MESFSACLTADSILGGFSSKKHYTKGKCVRIYSLARIGVLSCIPEVLLCQPLPVLVILRDIDALDFEDDRSRTVIAAGDHHTVIVGPVQPFIIEPL